MLERMYSANEAPSQVSEAQKKINFSALHEYY